ncbi:MAG: Hsp70 family protein [Candidatus Riflebacteria bacterium]|nr:Hsp70 family protein [Candidatus Riflebacteria bacterium]
MSQYRYLIGIDLGTTTSSLAYVDLEDKNLKIRRLQIKQPVAHNMEESLPVLPSALYINENEDNNFELLFGEYALELGSANSDYFIHSSKSWLCHPTIDRTQKILPWQSPSTFKLSPQEAAAKILKYLRDLWNETFAADDKSSLLENQKVIVTVPASFDPAAANMTLQAAKEAGLTNCSLLEEPQAAFYDYIQRNPGLIAEELKGIENVLVVDIGGGTTDFSLIKVTFDTATKMPNFERIAVGPHLLIGGDNIDLTILMLAEQAFRHKGKKLKAKQWLSLLSTAKAEKEKILSENPPKEAVFSIAGSGSKVLSGTVRVELKTEEIKETLLEGFLPLADITEKPQKSSSFGISEAGLPYTKDVAISRHLAEFLNNNNTMPDAVLFNGGTMKAECLKERILEILALWNDGKAPKILANPHPVLAVSAGAAYYAAASLGLGQKILSATPVSIYLGIGTAKSATSKLYLPEKLMCLMPRGTETEKEYSLENGVLGINLSQDSAVYLYYTPNPPKTEKRGRVIRFNSKRYLPLPPLKLKASTANADKEVTLSVKLSETGYFQIFCSEINGPFKKELHFDLTDKEQEVHAPDTEKAVPLNKKQLTDIAKLPKDAAKGKLEFNAIFKELETITELKRNDWDITTLRSIFDLLKENFSCFETSENAMTNFFRIAGFTLRPGYGSANDQERMDFVLKLALKEYDSKNPEFWSELWEMLKRIAPGLSFEKQSEIKDFIEPMLFPQKRGKKGREISQHEKNRLWRLLGNLERLAPAEKERLGDMIVANPMSYATDKTALAALSRIGARELAYASMSVAVSQNKASEWTNALLKKAIPGSSWLDTALRELGRKTGDRLVQLEETQRKLIIEVFRKKNLKNSFIKPLQKAGQRGGAELAEFTGEVLPTGFTWIKEE